MMTKGFNTESTTDDVLGGVDLSGKRILVTGVSAGIGLETARVLAAHGATVIGAARDLAKARAAGNDGLDLVELDLASLTSVRNCADALVASGAKFDVIIANAGVMACPEGKTKDGFETQFGTNHLGHFVFVNRIAKLLNPGGRVVSLTSSGHRLADVDLDDPNFERTAYNEFAAYGRSKTANVLFAVEFDRRHGANEIRATAVHPGGVTTELGRHMSAEALEGLVASINATQPAGAPPFRFKNPAEGAATSVWAGIVAPAALVGGKYCEDCHVAEIDESEGIHGGVKSYALNPTRAEALWAKSEELVGERF